MVEEGSFNLNLDGRTVSFSLHENSEGWPFAVDQDGTVHDRGATHEEVVEIAFGRGAVLDMRKQQQR